MRPKEPQVAQDEEEQQVPNIIQVKAPSSTQVAPPSTQQDQILGMPTRNPLDDDHEVAQDEAQLQVTHPRVRETIQKNNPVKNILGDIQKGVTTRSRVANFCEYYSFVSTLEPLKVD